VNAARVRRALIVPPSVPVPDRNRADPHLDTDLARWHDFDKRPSTPMIAILGEPSVRAPGTAPAQRVPWYTEMLVHLAVHPEGVTTDQARTDLWPEETTISSDTIDEAIRDLRTWAGTDRRTKPARTFVSTVKPDGRYRLHGHLLDWDLLERLRLRGRARAATNHPGALTDYRAALKLVRGPILQPHPAAGYRWMGRSSRPVDRLILRSIVTTAHELVDLALASEDTTTAQQAADIARRADTRHVFDLPLTDQMRIAHTQSNHTAVERLAALLLDLRGVDVAEELPPTTFRVMDLLLPDGMTRSTTPTTTTRPTR
jgi:hypothetical protein